MRISMFALMGKNVEKIGFSFLKISLLIRKYIGSGTSGVPQLRIITWIQINIYLNTKRRWIHQYQISLGKCWWYQGLHLLFGGWRWAFLWQWGCCYQWWDAKDTFFTNEFTSIKRRCRRGRAWHPRWYQLWSYQCQGYVFEWFLSIFTSEIHNQYHDLLFLH